MWPVSFRSQATSKTNGESTMAHVPNTPELYICKGCQNVYAGTVQKDPDLVDFAYEPPDECAACGNTEFIEIEEYPHFG